MREKILKFNKLKGKMREKGITYTTLGKGIGKTERTIYNKINGKTQWRVTEIDKIIEILQLTFTEASEIFFG